MVDRQGLDWRRCPDGALRADWGPLRVTVRPPEGGAYARFTIRRLPGQGPCGGAMVASGSRDGVAAALHDAEAAIRRAAPMAGAVPDSSCPAPPRPKQAQGGQARG